MLLAVSDSRGTPGVYVTYLRVQNMGVKLLSARLKANMLMHLLFANLFAG